MSDGDQTTGTSDVYFDLVSVLYHALEGAATGDRYIRDAEQAANQELADFFRQVQQEDRARAQRARELLDGIGKGLHDLG